MPILSSYNFLQWFHDEQIHFPPWFGDSDDEDDSDDEFEDEEDDDDDEESEEDEYEEYEYGFKDIFAGEPEEAKDEAKDFDQDGDSDLDDCPWDYAYNVNPRTNRNKNKNKNNRVPYPQYRLRPLTDFEIFWLVIWLYFAAWRPLSRRQVLQEKDLECLTLFFGLQGPIWIMVLEYVYKGFMMWVEIYANCWAFARAMDVWHVYRGSTERLEEVLAVHRWIFDGME